MTETDNAIKPTISTFSVTKRGKVAETYACFQSWDLSADLNDNLKRFRVENPILAPTDKWLEEMRKILRVRFGHLERHQPLIILAQKGIEQHQWAPILLWHLCYRELLLSDFLEQWLFPRKEEGLLRFRSPDVREYLASLKSRGLLERDWGENTIDKMASSLPGYAADFGLLSGRVVKEITPYHLPDKALLYILHAMMEESGSGRAVVEDIRWRRFLMDRGAVEEELFRLHQQRQLHFEIAGSVVSLELPYSTVIEYVENLVG